MAFNLRSAAAAAALLAASVNLSTRVLADTPPMPPDCLPGGAAPGYPGHPGLHGQGPAGFGPAEEPSHRHEAGPWGWPSLTPVPPWMHALHLSEAQKDQVFALMHAGEPALRDAFRQMRNTREALRTSAMQAATAPEQLRSLATGVGEADAALALLMAQTDQSLLAVLTDRQRGVLGACLAAAAGQAADR